MNNVEKEITDSEVHVNVNHITEPEHGEVTNAEKTMMEEPVYWDELLVAREDASDELIKQQVLFNELVNTYGDKLDADPELFKVVDGTLKTFYDLALEINNNSLTHATETRVEDEITLPVSYRKGVVKGIDDEMVYLATASTYIQTTEKIAYIASSAYIDVFTKLKMDASLLKQAVDDGTEELKGVANDRQCN